MNLQPYQEASKQIVKQQEAPGKFLKSAVGLGASLAGGKALLSRVIPLLNKHVPPELASKGLESIEPRFGKFFKGIFNNGFTIQDGLNYLRKKFTSNSEENEEDLEQAQDANPQPSPEIKQRAMSKFKQPGVLDQEKQRFEQQYGQENTQSNSVDEALIASLEKILKM